MNYQSGLFIHTILGVLILFYEFLRTKESRLDAILLVNVSYFLLYVYVPIAFFLIPEWVSVGAFKYLNANEIPILLLSLICLLGYILIISGIVFCKSLMRYSNNKILKIEISGNVTFFLFIVGVLSFFMYVSAYGGIANSILYGSATRYGGLDIGEVTSGVGLVFKRLLSALELVLFYFISMKFSGSVLNFRLKFIYFVSAFLYMLYLISASSRGAFVGVLLFLLFQYQLNKQKITYIRFSIIFLFGMFVLSFVLYGKQFLFSLPALLNGSISDFVENFEIMNSMRQADDTFFFRDTIFKEYTHGYVSLFYSLNGSNELLYFRDYFNLPISLIPTNLLGLTITLPPSVSAINTFNIQGELIASIPPGILAMLFYNLSYTGILALFFVGMVIYFIQSIFQSNSGALSKVLLFDSIIICGAFISNADILVLVFDSLFYFIFLVFFIFKFFLSKSSI